MKKWLAGCFFLVLTYCAQAQDTILVAGMMPQLYIYHGVLPGENFYSIGRKFNVSPHAIARLNNVDMQNGLKAYQLIKIPLTPSNFTQAGRSPGDEAQPLYHKVQPHETLYHIGVEHNKVAPGLLRAWNHLPGNSIAAGQYLIVGWLKRGATEAAPADGTSPALQNAEPVVAQAAPEAAAAPGGNEITREHTPETAAGSVPDSAPATTAALPEDGGFLSEVIAAERNKRKSRRHASAGAAAPVTTAPATTATARVAPAAAAPAAPSPAVTSPGKGGGEMVQKKAPAQRDGNEFSRMLSRVGEEARQQSAQSAAAREKRKQKPPQANKAPAPHVSAQVARDTTAAATAGIQDTAGAVPGNFPEAIDSPFEALYLQQTANGAAVSSEKGAGGWFKSNVVPGSGRYYALCDNAPRGTVIKVTNPVNGKWIYVKVLDAIPKLGENHNLLIKISDAAMQDLGITQSRFWCRVEYKKTGT